VPPEASSNLPSCWRSAPVNAPRSWPKSELGRDRREVHRDERAVGPVRLAVNEPREQLLARAALAQNEHGGVQLRHPVHEVHDVPHGAARPDQEFPVGLLGHLGAERHDLPVEVLALGGVAHERAERVVVEILRDVVVGAVLHRLHGRLDLVDGRDHDELDERVILLDDAEDLEAADAGQPDVEQHEVDVLFPQQRQRGFPARRGQDAVVGFEDRREDLPHPLVVVDDEDRLGLGAHDRRRANDRAIVGWRRAPFKVGASAQASGACA
jgi:hypothetical protein